MPWNGGLLEPGQEAEGIYSAPSSGVRRAEMTSPEVEDIKRYMDEVVGRIVAEVDAIIGPVLADAKRRREEEAGTTDEGGEAKRKP